MTQNWTSIVEFDWIFFKFYQLIYLYIYIYIIFVSNELFLVKKKRLINIQSFKLSLTLILYKVLDNQQIHIVVLNIWLSFLWFIYIELLVFYSKLTYLAQKLKKLRLDRTCTVKLNSNWNPIFTLN